MDPSTYENGVCKLRFPHLIIIGGKMGNRDYPQYYISSVSLEYVDETYFNI